MPDLRPLLGGPLVERVVAEIRNYIEINGLEPGHKLPPERVFMERMGVGRSSLREALRVLSTVGLIQVRRGHGMYVAARPDDVSSTAIFDHTEVDALRNLVETRLGIEMAAATAVISRATDEDLSALERLLDAQAEALENDPGYAWPPLEFELALIELTGNSWLQRVELMLAEAWISMSKGLPAKASHHSEWLNEHRAILASIRTRNVAQVQRLIAAHLSFERFDDDLKNRVARPKRPRSTKGRPST